MCKECQQTFCPPECPNFDGSGAGYRVKLCAACGGEIFDDSHYLILGVPFCLYCAEHASASDLADFFEFPETKDLIEELGGEYCQD
ncbi:MAG: hypothetical protein IJW79_12015 [Clostridia bacterium]|nr:hypothetical protein [Clostridia bacterium]